MMKNRRQCGNLEVLICFPQLSRYGKWSETKLARKWENNACCHFCRFAMVFSPFPPCHFAPVVMQAASGVSLLSCQRRKLGSEQSTHLYYVLGYHSSPLLPFRRCNMHPSGDGLCTHDEPLPGYNPGPLKNYTWTLPGFHDITRNT